MVITEYNFFSLLLNKNFIVQVEHMIILVIRRRTLNTLNYIKNI